MKIKKEDLSTQSVHLGIARQDEQYKSNYERIFGNKKVKCGKCF
jgi:hypothetical protein